MSMSDSAAALQQALLAGSGELLLAVSPATLSIVAANPRACALLGYPLEQLVGRPITDIESTLQDMFFWNAVGDGNIEELENAEGLYACADGRLLPVEKSIRVHATAAGPLLVIRASDNQEQERAATDLAEAGALLAATLESTAEGILVVDLDGRIENFNRRFAAVWQIPDDVIHGGDDHAIVRHLRRQLAGGFGDQRRLLRLLATRAADTLDTFTLADGRSIECRSRPRQMQDRLLGRVISFSDISERIAHEHELAKARDEAWRATRAKSEFLATMSHEIRTPMNGVIGMAELLMDTPLNDEQSRFAQTIRSSGELLLGIINDVLDVSKIESGKLVLETVDFDFHAVIADVVALMSFRAREKGVTLNATINPTLPQWLRGDPLRLRQVLLNLCSNAIKFTEHGSVTIACTSDTPRHDAVGLRVAVSDTGIGISSDSARALFMPFVQADVSTTRRFGGTGLGLSICKRLIEMMGGAIGVSSEEGQGATFWFSLALPHGKAATARTATSISMPTRPLCILVADDNTVNRQVLSTMLERRGHAVTLAENGRQALERMQDTVFDLVLMDCQMPELDGYEASRRLRAGAAGSSNQETPVIACTASSMSDKRDRCLAAGMNDLILKPIRWDVLADLLTRWTKVSTESVTEPRAAASGKTSNDIFNPVRMLSAMAGDGDLARVAVTGVLDNMPQEIELLRAALASGDGTVATRAAHSIKGMAATVCGEETRAAAERIESAGQEGSLVAATALHALLVEQWNNLQSNLLRWHNDTPAGKP